MAFSLRRASSISSANSQDSLEDFLSEVRIFTTNREVLLLKVADRQFLGDDVNSFSYSQEGLPAGKVAKLPIGDINVSLLVILLS